VVLADDSDAQGMTSLPHRWRSPVRGPWLTSVFGLVLLIGIPIEFITGLLSYAAYDPKLGSNDPNPSHGAFGLYVFNWITEPSWLYRLIEGVHVVLGLVLVPVVLAKLWSVIPQLFAWPPFQSLARLLERISLMMVVGGIVFEMTTGILYIDYYQKYGFSFYTGHFYGAWIFMSGFTVHVILKFPKMVRSLKSRRLRTELRTGLAGTLPEPADDVLVASHPDPPTISRRGVLAMVAGSSLSVFLLTAGDTIGGAMRRLDLLGTRVGAPGVGPNHFPVNHTAAAQGVGPLQTGAAWRLELVGSERISLSRDELLVMSQLTEVLPIACTEGWSTVQRWTGVPLADLARLAGAANATSALLETLDASPTYISGSQVHARQSLLALRVNGADLSLDHGYPARVMIPNAPGTHNKKWMQRITFFEVD
jgi:DMSO/TMAO reductase YedYZ molybdopterin-dependent catalytic subunit